ncbi:MAG TPA: glutamyl-tRNA reductase [Nocardioidaceae bacterium]|nr:glutamyl-tRNA reductase [Nocardioidaceae bacterium]
MTTLVCLSVPGCRVPVSVLESLSFARAELTDALEDLRRRTGAAQLCVLSTCERTEVYACWEGAGEASTLVQAVAANRGLPPAVVEEAATLLTGHQATRHLLRVATGLESFVLGERDIVGQVRAAADASRASGVSGLELDRLLATAVNTSRRVHRCTGFGAGGRSVAAAAVALAAAENGGDLADRRVLVVGAGQVATEVAESAALLGATVTVCNRTKRHAERLAAAGASVVDLAQLVEVLPASDVAIFGTAAPHRLLDAERLAPALAGRSRNLLVLDLCVPRNVDPDVGTLTGARLVDLDELRAVGAAGSEEISRDVARAEQIVGEELDRYLRWLAGRAAATSVRQMRADLERCTRTQVAQATRDVPEELRPLLEDGIRRVVRRLAHGPTKRLIEAAEAGDEDLVEVLAGLFAVP